MSASKQTPGPWWVDLDDPPNVYVSSGNPADVESIRNLVEVLEGYDQQASRIPNARLIAAAHETYEITKGVEKCDACDGDGRHRHLNGEYADNRTCSACGGTGAVLGRSVTWQAVQAALAKVEGK